MPFVPQWAVHLSPLIAVSRCLFYCPLPRRRAGPGSETRLRDPVVGPTGHAAGHTSHWLNFPKFAAAALNYSPLAIWDCLVNQDRKTQTKELHGSWRETNACSISEGVNVREQRRWKCERKRWSACSSFFHKTCPYWIILRRRQKGDRYFFSRTCLYLFPGAALLGTPPWVSSSISKIYYFIFSEWLRCCFAFWIAFQQRQT